MGGTIESALGGLGMKRPGKSPVRPERAVYPLFSSQTLESPRESTSTSGQERYGLVATHSSDLAGSSPLDASQRRPFSVCR
jgi:hypothetical protein